MKKKHRIAIARIVSDMIKADNIIEETEIEMLNNLKNTYNLDRNIMVEARRVKFSSAIESMEDMCDEDKIAFFKSVQSMALVDGVCVPREALLLLALRYAFGIEAVSKNGKNLVVNHNNKVKLIACPTGDTSITSQYVIYIEGKYNDEINQDIKKGLDVNVLRLREYGFDFVYIPCLVDEFREMNADYVKDVVSYMAPELAQDTIDVVYDRLLKMDTVTFCNHVLAEKLKVDSVKHADPSLLINIGTSFVPYTSVSGPVECYTEFLCIPITKDIDAHIKDFLNAYKKIVSYYTILKPDAGTGKFKYFGFYKAMFDFLVKAEPKESDMIVNPCNSRFEFPHVSIEDLKLTPQEAALYKLILELTHKHPLGGLPTFYTSKELEIKSLYEKIYKICKGCEVATLPDNLAPIRSRIEKKMRDQLEGLANIEEFIPRMREGKYIVMASPDRIKIKAGPKDDAIDFTEYTWGK